MTLEIQNQMTVRQTIAGLIFLPFHAVILPLCLPLLTSILPLDEVSTNLIYYGIGILFVAIVMLPFLRRCFDFIVDNPLVSFLIFLSTMGVYYILSCATVLVMQLLEISFEEPPNDTAVVALSELNAGVVKSLSIFAAPIVEEVLFRGVIFGAIRGRSRALAYAVSALVFSLFHVWEYAVIFHDAGMLLYIIQYLPVSFALAYSYDRTGCIWLPIAFHMLNNAAAFMVSGI